METGEWVKYADLVKNELKENMKSCQITDGVWVTENYLIIPADSGKPHKEPWGTISQYIAGWHSYERLRKESSGLIRPLHVILILNCYAYPGTLVFSLEGSPPRGRLVVGFYSYEPIIRSVTFIGYKARQYRDINGLPVNLRTALHKAIELVLSKWSKTRD